MSLYLTYIMPNVLMPYVYMPNGVYSKNMYTIQVQHEYMLLNK